MTNPWRWNFLGSCRDLVRFSLWVCVAVNGAMAAIFSIFFIYQFLTHLWTYLMREWFPGTW